MTLDIHDVTAISRHKRQSIFLIGFIKAHGVAVDRICKSMIRIIGRSTEIARTIANRSVSLDKDIYWLMLRETQLQSGRF